MPKISEEKSIHSLSSILISLIIRSVIFRHLNKNFDKLEVLLISMDVYLDIFFNLSTFINKKKRPPRLTDRESVTWARAGPGRRLTSLNTKYYVCLWLQVDFNSWNSWKTTETTEISVDPKFWIRPKLPKSTEISEKCMLPKLPKLCEISRNVWPKLTETFREISRNFGDSEISVETLAATFQGTNRICTFAEYSPRKQGFK